MVDNPLQYYLEQNLLVNKIKVDVSRRGNCVNKDLFNSKFCDCYISLSDDQKQEKMYVQSFNTLKLDRKFSLNCFPINKMQITFLATKHGGIQLFGDRI